MRLLQGDPYPDLLRSCRREAFHLEVRDSYGVAVESEPLQRFLSGEPTTDFAWFQPWQSLIEETTSRGVAVRRVRVLTEPHSDYHRWMLTITPQNIEAGEEIRYLPRHLAGDVPAEDYWLLDEERVAFHARDADGRGLGVAMTSDAWIVDHCVGMKRRLWELATPFENYAAARSSQ
ncbi:hypothetical protein GV794_19350 [Nocardia cyriacigeorgica]|uniref:DUF6879 domain-containing protein n=1 Tax=Nocardia cyriacigeorgica TaxID=135487 RepID=A0A6P1DB08_9NOCA|nr:DUF6879 family protein [Nocardia cyriacigeorgica]NEW42336.1 hypothetical protein [Nocardia cyriacigeorgica]NEW46040.1 hypothetical protein [Nocardia cyriacigeorgica]NEW53233.1 hypothetical protein [Nocardia cyriacigeorgica]NEW57796.1 hypothetical protein [Nocardia cyriacigeorgica]